MVLISCNISSNVVNSDKSKTKVCCSCFNWILSFNHWLETMRLIINISIRLKYVYCNGPLNWPTFWYTYLLHECQSYSMSVMDVCVVMSDVDHCRNTFAKMTSNAWWSSSFFMAYIERILGKVISRITFLDLWHLWVLEEANSHVGLGCSLGYGDFLDVKIFRVNRGFRSIWGNKEIFFGGGIFYLLDVLVWDLSVLVSWVYEFDKGAVVLFVNKFLTMSKGMFDGVWVDSGLEVDGGFLLD